MQETNTLQPLIFIHGAWHGAWCWDEWKEYFKELGYTATTVELRGHGYKGGNYKRATLSNYVSDVKLLINEFETPPVLVGHSLGCSIIQHIISNDEFPAAVLIAPIPKTNTYRRIIIKKVCRHPFLALKSILAFNMRPWVTSRISRKLFFSKEMDKNKAQAYLARMQGESFRLFVIDLMKQLPIKVSNTPTLVVAAEKDSFFHPRSQQALAAHTSSEYMVSKNSGHDVMLDVNAMNAARDIGDWLKKYN